MSPASVVDGGADAVSYLSNSSRLFRLGRYEEAEASARSALAAQPRLPMAHNNLGVALQNQGRPREALDAFRTALRLDPKLRMARRNLAVLLATLGDRNNSLPLVHAELLEDGDLTWLQRRITAGMASRDLFAAGELAWMSAVLRRGSDWYPVGTERAGLTFPLREPPRKLTIAKLRHDIEQFEYIQRRGVLGDALLPAIAQYSKTIAELSPRAENVPVPLVGRHLESVGDTFNRILYVRKTSRVSRALSGSWDPSKVERRYLDMPFGVVVIDNFLSPEALNELRAFCLESTVWLANRYAHGRLGAFFQEGFNCPLLLQIAEELRAAMPNVIGDKHTLRQIWGFKNSTDLPEDATTHADFAAVNVNFWITPDAANTDQSSGGLVVYGVDAPLHWDFHTYNGRSDIIMPFIQRQNAKCCIIPYRQNRVVIFNSDLFHGTCRVRFRQDYENRRINVTMLYGIREDDHRHLAKPEPPTDSGARAWRSAAFTRLH